MARDVILDVGANTAPMIRDINQALSALDKRGLSKLTLDSRRLTEPLGRITGKVDEFTKSLEASNARVLAFTASAGALFAITKAFREMVKATVEVEKSLADINVILNADVQTLKKFSGELFKVAANTGQSFSQVATAATELARQGLGVEKTLKRTSDALILARLSGQDAGKSVEALTAILNTFQETAITSSQVISKLARVDAAFAVSTNDLTQAFSRVGATALEAGVSFDQLNGIVTAVQERTARGGSVIGNALRTIFTRIRRPETLKQLRDLKIAIKDVEGNTLPALRILTQLSDRFDGLSDAQRSNIVQTVAGVRQGNILRATLSDLASKHSVVRRATLESAAATNEAEIRNRELNKTLDAQFNRLKENAREFASFFGQETLAPGLTKAFSAGSGLLEAGQSSSMGVQTGLEIGKSILKGMGAVLAGPGLIAVGFTITKIFANTIGFAIKAAKTFNAITPAAQKNAAIQEAVTAHLRSQPGLLQGILSGTIKRAAAEKEILTILQAQRVAAMESARAANMIIPGVIKGGGGLKGFSPKGALKIPGAANGNVKFHSSVGDAVRREVSAGVPRTAIRLGASAALAGPRNPSGLAITNTRDEPRGIRDIIPNFAKKRPGQPTMGFKSFDDLSLFQETMKGISNEAKVSTESLEKLKGSMAKSSQATSSFDKAVKKSQKIAGFKEHIRNQVEMPGVSATSTQSVGNRGNLIEYSGTEPFKAGDPPGRRRDRAKKAWEGFKDRNFNPEKPGKMGKFGARAGGLKGMMAAFALSSVSSSIGEESTGGKLLGGAANVGLATASGAQIGLMMGGPHLAAILGATAGLGTLASELGVVSKVSKLLGLGFSEVTKDLNDVSGLLKISGMDSTFAQVKEGREKDQKREEAKFILDQSRGVNLTPDRFSTSAHSLNQLTGGYARKLGFANEKDLSPEAQNIKFLMEGFHQGLPGGKGKKEFGETLNSKDGVRKARALLLMQSKEINNTTQKQKMVEAASAITELRQALDMLAFSSKISTDSIRRESAARIDAIGVSGEATRAGIKARTTGLGLNKDDTIDHNFFTSITETANKKITDTRAARVKARGDIDKAIKDAVKSTIDKLISDSNISVDDELSETKKLTEVFRSKSKRDSILSSPNFSENKSPTSGEIEGFSVVGERFKALKQLSLTIDGIVETFRGASDEHRKTAEESVKNIKETKTLEQRRLEIERNINKITEAKLEAAEINATQILKLFNEGRASGAENSQAQIGKLMARIRDKGAQPGDFERMKGHINTPENYVDRLKRYQETETSLTASRRASARADRDFRAGKISGGDRVSANKAFLDESISQNGIQSGDFGKGSELAFQSVFQKSNVDVFNTVMSSIEELSASLKDGLTNALADTILGAKSASEAFSNLANAILKMVVKSGLETAFDAVLSSAGKRFASGGIVTGGSGVRDDVPAKLTSGEFVVKRSAVSKVGMPFLNALNSGGFASLAGGGFANINLSNKTNFIGNQRTPTGANFDIDPSLSAFALQNGPASARRSRRISQFHQGRANYAAAIRAFEAQKKARRMAAMINVGVQVGAAGLQGGFNRGGGAGGVDPGGEIPLNSGGNVPAMLTGGEVVINRQTSQAIGSVGMNRINNGQVAGFSGGGSVGGSSKGMRSESVEKIVESLLDIKEEIKIGNKTSSSNPKAKKQGGSSTPISLSMPISITNVNEGGGSGGQESDDNSTEEDDERTKMANDLLETMKAAALDVINEQQRPGGILFDAS
jgi:TP901 family phage tail tape measure protein